MGVGVWEKGSVQITVHSYNNTVSCFPPCTMHVCVVSCVLQVDQMLRGAPVDAAGNFDYVAFTRILKHGTKDE